MADVESRNMQQCRIKTKRTRSVQFSLSDNKNNTRKIRDWKFGSCGMWRREEWCVCLCVCFGGYSPQWARASSFTRFLDHAQRRTSGRVITPSHRPLPDNTQHSQQTNIHASGGIRTHNLSMRAAADPRLRPRDHWGRREVWY